jgi:hypothetical protein
MMAISFPKWWPKSSLEKKVDLLMTTVNDLKPILDAIAADQTATTASLATIATNTAALKTSIASLQAQLAALGTGGLSAADQATLDAANAEAATIKTAADNIATAAASAATP